MNEQLLFALETVGSPLVILIAANRVFANTRPLPPHTYWQGLSLGYFRLIPI